MEHSMQLGSEHFIKVVSPTAGTAVLKKIKRVLNNAEAGDMYDLDRLNNELAGIEDEGDDRDADDTEFDAGDTIGKALALVKQVCTFTSCSKYTLTLFADMEISASVCLFHQGMRGGRCPCAATLILG